MAGKASNELLTALGAAVRARRLDREMTQEALAEGTGLHATYVSDIERGRRNIGILNLERVARALSVELSTLIGEAEARRRGGRTGL